MTPARIPALASQDPVFVVAPSGPVQRERVHKSRAELRARGIEVEIAAQVRSKAGYLAGADRERYAALREVLMAQEPRTLWPARGGYGLTRLLSRLPATLEKPPRVIGFSDISALLCALYSRYRIPSIHGPVFAQWAELPPEQRERAWSMLCGEIPAPLEAASGPALLGGVVEGPLIASNLELLRSLIGTPDFPQLQGAILAIEDVGERPYRLDRSLTQLLESGSLRGLRGIALGTFHACDPPRDGEPHALQVVVERLATLQVPLLGGFPFGHRPGENAALPFGTRVRLHVDQGLLEMLEPVFGEKIRL